MSALSIQPTYPIFTDIDGQPLEDGFVWIGQANLDPQVNPINVFWDAALTIPAGQPIRTLGGYPANSGTPARLYVNSDYSIRVMNKNGSVVYSAPAATERYSDAVISPISASIVIYTPDGANAVETDSQEKLRERVSLFDFMTQAEISDVVSRAATIDVSDKIQNALVQAAARGQEVFAPAGIYKITKNIYCGPNTSIVGEGTWDAVFASTPVRGTVFECIDDNVFVFYALSESEIPVGINWPSSNNPNSAHSIRMESFTIWGANTTQRGIVIGDAVPVTQIDIQNVTIRDCLIGVDMRAAYGINIRGVYPRVSAPVPVGSKGFQIGTNGSPTSGTIENCFVFSCETGMFVGGGSYYPGFVVKDIDFDGCRWGVMIGNDPATGNIEAPNMFQSLGFENISESDVYIRVAQGNIGIRGYLIASVSGYAGPNIDAIANTNLNLYLSDGRTVGAITGIQSSANVTVHTSNWEFGNAVSTGTNKLLQKAEFVRGTWTPSLVGSGGGSFTYATPPTGEFVKMGNLVFVTCSIELATNSGVGNLEIHGLPFTVNAPGCQASSFNYGRVTLDANYTTLGAQFANSTTTMTIFEVGSGTTISTNAVAASQAQATAFFVFSGTYITA